MALQLPESMDELVYWTARKWGEGSARVWVHKEMCPACGKALMGKPVDKGKVKIRASHYECPECGHKVGKSEYEATLTACILYTCPECKAKGEGQIPFKRKKYQGVDSLVFECSSCKAKIPVTKKMKEV